MYLWKKKAFTAVINKKICHFTTKGTEIQFGKTLK